MGWIMMMMMLVADLGVFGEVKGMGGMELRFG